MVPSAGSGAVAPGEGRGLAADAGVLAWGRAGGAAPGAAASERQRSSGRAGAPCGTPAGKPRSGDSVMGGRLERLFSVRKAGLSDAELFSPRSHASVSGFSRTGHGENPRSAESISPESAPIGHASPTIPMAWGRTRMPEERPFGDIEDDADPAPRPSWQDTPRRNRRRPEARRPGAPGPAISGQPLPPSPDTWLRPAPRWPACSSRWCDATRRARPARRVPRRRRAPMRCATACAARMATAEAAGWLAHAHAWVHPLDLSLRAAGLTASTALAAVGHGQRSLPQTFAGAADPPDWADPPFDAMADGDRAVADALSLVRLLCRLPGRQAAGPFATPSAAAAALQPLGAGALDPARLAAWWTAHAPSPPVPRRYGSRAGEGTREKTLPPLLAGAMRRMPRRARRRPASPSAPARCSLCSPPAAGAAATDRPARSSCRSGPAIRPWGFRRARRTACRPAQRCRRPRLLGRGRPVTLAARFPASRGRKRARMALRELDRLEAAAAQGRGVVAGGDRRSRLPDALDALLRTPALTPKALAARLKVAPQTGTALLRALQGRGVVREVTGRGVSPRLRNLTVRQP